MEKLLCGDILNKVQRFQTGATDSTVIRDEYSWHHKYHFEMPEGYL